MSGIEILGVAASVIQIADLGARLSVKLFTFSRKIKAADKSIDSISQEIAATGAVLHQLGNELSKDENAELCSKEALATTKDLVDRCMDVFNDLNSSLDGNLSSNSIVAGWKQRLKFPFLEEQIQLLRTNMERLKSSLLIMLNVLIFAAQARSHRDIGLLKDHRELIEILIEEKNDSERRYQQAQQAIGEASAKRPDKEAKETVTWHPLPYGTVNAVVNAGPRPVTALGQIDASETRRPPPPFGLRFRLEEIRNHGIAIRTLLTEVNSFNREMIGYDFRDKLQRGILGAHWQQWAPLREVYGEKVLMDAFSEQPEVVQFWLSKLETSGFSFSHEKTETTAPGHRMRPDDRERVERPRRRGQNRQHVSTDKMEPNIVLRKQVENLLDTSKPDLPKPNQAVVEFPPDKGFVLGDSAVADDFDFDSFLRVSRSDAEIDVDGDDAPQTVESFPLVTERTIASESRSVEGHFLRSTDVSAPNDPDMDVPERQPSQPSTFDEYIRRYTQLSSSEYTSAT